MSQPHPDTVNVTASPLIFQDPIISVCVAIFDMYYNSSIKIKVSLKNNQNVNLKKCLFLFKADIGLLFVRLCFKKDTVLIHQIAFWCGVTLKEFNFSLSLIHVFLLNRIMTLLCLYRSKKLNVLLSFHVKRSSNDEISF